MTSALAIRPINSDLPSASYKGRKALRLAGDTPDQHSLLFSRGLLGFTDFTPEVRAKFARVRQHSPP
jgi:hypothetical protein